MKKFLRTASTYRVRDLQPRQSMPKAGVGRYVVRYITRLERSLIWNSSLESFYTFDNLDVTVVQTIR